MSIISTIILVTVFLALIYTYWSLIKSVKKPLRHRFLAGVAIMIFLSLGTGLLTILYKLFFGGPINAGTLLGMIFGITLIFSGIRSFPGAKTK